MLKLCHYNNHYMAHLFKDKVIKAELENYIIPDFDNKISRVKTWHEAYKNKSLHAKTESQCEQAFNQHFFVEILGYLTFPAESYTLDPKGTADASAQKADAVLGYFSKENSRVTAVVEIKDVNTSLDRSQRREGNLSPIQQAFKYKPQYKDCAFVIATNFYEIRLFLDNQLDYESFTLDDLVEPENDYYNFRKFYYLLNAENFVIKHGKSNTEKLLSEIRVEQEKITKSFYRDYKDLRQSLINNLVKNNTNNHNFETIIEKAQKIIDRIVFICFCEDKDLIPENKLQEVVFHTEKLGLTIPVWDIMKGFFKAIDEGSAKLGIPDGYNGELFKEDTILNNMFVDDEICKRFVDFGKYDFSEDLSVNILGHIFEQSITDLEELKSFVDEKALDKKKSKRKKDGIFYTPDYIVDYIVKNSLGAYLEEKEKEILKNYDLKEDINEKNYEKRALKAYQEYQEFVRNIKVLDPACGSGAFLVKVFDYLLAENKRIADILADLSGGTKDLFSSENYIKNLLENNIYGVDLNPESVEITKLSLWLKTAIKGKKLVSLKGNIKCGNSLIDDENISNKAFKWEEEFSEIMKEGGFDVIVGNPPYVRVQNLKYNEIDWYKKNKETAYKRIDISILFIELAKKLLKKEGILSFITSNQFLITEYGEKMRQFIKKNLRIKSIIDFGDLPIFEDALTYVSIFTLENATGKDFLYYRVRDINDGYNLNTKLFKKIEINSLDEKSWALVPKENKKILDKLNKLPKISKIGKAWAGLFTGLDEIMMIDKGKIKDLDIEMDILLPVIRAENCKRYFLIPPEKYVIYPYKLDMDNKTVILKEEEFKKLYPKCYNYLFDKKELLLKRKDSRKKLKEEKWYQLTRFGQKKVFSERKIVTPGEVKEHKFSIDETKAGFSCARVFAITINDKKYSYEFLLGILNSALIKYYLHSIAPLKQGGYYTYSSNILNSIPIIESNYQNQTEITEKVHEIIISSRKAEDKKENFVKLIKQEFELTKPSNKLGKFYELTFDEFLKTTKLEKVSLNKKEELLIFFEKHKQELLEIKEKIKIAEEEIDQTVFDLYGLTDEEKSIILS